MSASSLPEIFDVDIRDMPFEMDFYEHVRVIASEINSRISQMDIDASSVVSIIRAIGHHVQQKQANLPSDVHVLDLTQHVIIEVARGENGRISHVPPEIAKKVLALIGVGGIIRELAEWSLSSTS